MKHTESTENYLKTILILSKRNGFVRSIDIVRELSFSKPSVSAAMKSFREKNYITVDDDGRINLTPSGLKIAEDVYDRYQTLASALIGLGVDEETAYEDSCRIEHSLSDKSFDKIKRHFESHQISSSRSRDIDVVLL